MNTRGERGAARLADRSQRSIKDTSGQSRPVQKQPLTSSRDQRLRGDAGNRTRIHGFAERCLRAHHPCSELTRGALGTGLRSERGAGQRLVTANDGQRRPLPHSARPRISTAENAPERGSVIASWASSEPHVHQNPPNVHEQIGACALSASRPGRVPSRGVGGGQHPRGEGGHRAILESDQATEKDAR